VRFIFFILIFVCFSSYAKERFYELNIETKDVRVDGEQYDKKFLVNGSLPAPTLEFIEGETAVIKVINHTDEKTLIHWHGLLIKNDQDGVPYVNSLPIEPRSEKTYRFKLIQNGTYWYHSHVMFQEEDGLYGAFIIYPENYKKNALEKEIVLSDLSHESGETIQKNIKKQGEYYDVFKGTVQSWLEAFRSGNALTKWRNSFQRMEGMDYADIAYDKFLANGTSNLEIFKDLKERKKVKLRLINGSATSIYKVTYSGRYISVVGADGLPVEPVRVRSLPISVAETYDIILDYEPGRTHELKVTSIDNSGKSLIHIGQGELSKAPDMYWEHPIAVTMGEMMGMKEMNFFSELVMNYKNEFKDIPKDMSYEILDKYSLPNNDLLMPMMSKHNHMSKMSHSIVNSNLVDPDKFRIMNRSPEVRESNIYNPQEKIYKELTYGLLKSKKPINIDNVKKLRTVNFTLNGNMSRYVWSINGKPLEPDTYIKINKGERVRFIMKNTTMMNHPMHLHGHFFRVMTNQGKWSVLKHTVNVAPLDQTVIEFEANEEKDWFFHCHILYHMMGGMTRIVRYEDNPGPKSLESARFDSEEFNYADKFFARSRNFFQNNYSRTETSFYNSYYAFDLDILGNYKDEYEGEVHISRILTRYLEPYIGLKTESEEGGTETSPTIGLTWVLPLNISFDLKYQPEMEKKYEIEFESEIQLTSKLQFNYEFSSIRSYYAELEYRQTRNLSFVASYNKTFDNWGAGLGYTY
jgi:CopA family copper-resistance protein